ncbi:unnamed protein product, partial [Brugia timori]|uniref:N-terminal Ras-GEF domain-containing protein n=1 Tax=Brugia timori TaxID=42155 RepID=A0A0R3R4A9_9BILA
MGACSFSHAFLEKYLFKSISQKLLNLACKWIELMDPDVYNEIADFADSSLNYGKSDAQSNSSVNILNNIVRGLPKRISAPDNCDALDWHMRVNCDNNEKERDVKRKNIGDEMVERLTRRISWARKRRRLTDLQTDEKTEQNVSLGSKKSEVLLYPPRGGAPWIGFTDPTELQRFYIVLRSAEQTVHNGGGDKSRIGTLKFGFTEKVLNSGFDFEVSSIVSEDTEEGSAFIQDNLWVEKYAPHTYADLISDE